MARTLELALRGHFGSSCQFYKSWTICAAKVNRNLHWGVVPPPSFIFSCVWYTGQSGPTYIFKPALKWLLQHHNNADQWPWSRLDYSKVKISCDSFSGPEKGRLWCLMASSRWVSGRARLNTPRWKQVPDFQSPIASFVRRDEALFFLHDVWHPQNFGSLLVEFHLERWDDLVEFSILFQKS